MAVTTEQQGRTNVSGNRLTVSLKVATDDTTWDAGGISFDATTWVANPDMVHLESNAGYVFDYDRTNKKIRAFVQTDPADSGGANVALVEATGLDLSGDITANTGVIIRVMITGARA
jgi:hypothetical protein